jgi:hypothetical protein
MTSRSSGTCDGDFRSGAMQRRGVRVMVVSTISSQPPMVADELRRQADTFIDLVELRSKVSRDPLGAPPIGRATPSSFAGVAISVSGTLDKEDIQRLGINVRDWIKHRWEPYRNSRSRANSTICSACKTSVTNGG